MKKLLETILPGVMRVNSVIIVIEKVWLVILMVGMLIFGFLQVFSRYVVKAPIDWSEELLTYSFAWASFIGASLAIYTKRHFSVDLLVRSLTPRLQKAVGLFTWSIVFVFSIFLLLMGWRLTLANSIQMMNVLPISMVWAYLAMPVSGLFILIHTAQILLELILGIDREEARES